MEYFLFTDETNQQRTDIQKFFIYGGLFLPSDKLNVLHDLIESARINNGFRPTDPLKFDSHTRPAHIERAQHLEAKKSVVRACNDIGAKFMACLVLHDIAMCRSMTQLIGYGLNTLLYAFDQFLIASNSTGFCVVDPLPMENQYHFLREKFQKGLIFPERTRRFNKIKLFTASPEGCSHANSAIDIVLGTFGYCVNQRNPNHNPSSIFQNVVKMMWHKRIGDRIQIGEHGLFLRPKQIVVTEHKAEYDRLLQHLRGLI